MNAIVNVNPYWGIGADGQLESIDNLSQVINAGMAYGIHTLGVVAVGKDMERTDRYFKLATRIVAEMGVQIVKTYNCEHFDEIVAACPVPIVVAGGKKQRFDGFRVANVHLAAVCMDVKLHFPTGTVAKKWKCTARIRRTTSRRREVPASTERGGKRQTCPGTRKDARRTSRSCE